MEVGSHKPPSLVEEGAALMLQPTCVRSMFNGVAQHLQKSTRKILRATADYCGAQLFLQSLSTLSFSHASINNCVFSKAIHCRVFRTIHASLHKSSTGFGGSSCAFLFPSTESNAMSTISSRDAPLSFFFCRSAIMFTIPGDLATLLMSSSTCCSDFPSCMAWAKRSFMPGRRL